MKKVKLFVTIFILVGLTGFFVPMIDEKSSLQPSIEVEFLKTSGTETAQARFLVKWNYWGTYYTIFTVDIDITAYTAWWGTYQIYYFYDWDDYPYDDWDYNYYTVGWVHRWLNYYLGTSPDWDKPKVILTPTYFQGRAIQLTYTYEGQSDQSCCGMPVFGAWVQYKIRLVLNSDGSSSAYIDSWIVGNGYSFQKSIS
ncbi:MAG: hypothetical protein ACFE96_08070 [Candidatus Hermodarchaeota archaeon]